MYFVCRRSVSKWIEELYLLKVFDFDLRLKVSVGRTVFG